MAKERGPFAGLSPRGAQQLRKAMQQRENPVPAEGETGLVTHTRDRIGNVGPNPSDSNRPPSHGERVSIPLRDEHGYLIKNAPSIPRDPSKATPEDIANLAQALTAQGVTLNRHEIRGVIDAYLAAHSGFDQPSLQLLKAFGDRTRL